MAYHSQQVLLLRYEQEKHLDKVLKRKEKDGELPQAFADPIICDHLSHCRAKNVIFVLVATPVEEVGRDHDFDWAIVEPSSYRSIIQMAGRVRRHRDGEVLSPNVGLLQYNFKGFKGEKDRVFNYPGYETDPQTQLNTHDLTQLTDEASLKTSVNAIPRIQKRETSKPKANLADLEHFSTARILGINEIGQQNKVLSREERRNRSRRSEEQSDWSKHLHGHIQGYWWLTALPQYFKGFRKSKPTLQIYLVEHKRSYAFCVRDEDGDMHVLEKNLRIQWQSIEPKQQKRLWLPRDYSQSIRQYDAEQALWYGEVNFIYDDKKQDIYIYIYIYSDQFGLVRKG